jgi:hypothetical protein
MGLGLAAAQTSPDERGPKVEGNADLSLTKTTGNSPTSTLGLSGRFVGRPGRFEIELQWFGYRSRAGGTLNSESVSIVSRLSRSLTERVSVFAQHDYFHDPFSGLGDGHFTTAGVAITIRDDDEQTLKFDGSVGRNNQTGYRAQPGAGAIVGVLYRWAFGPTSDLTHETRLLTMFSSSSARRLESTTSVTVGMTAILSMRFSFALRQQHTPRPQFRSRDTTTSTALVVSF